MIKTRKKYRKNASTSKCKVSAKYSETEALSPILPIKLENVNALIRHLVDYIMDKMHIQTGPRKLKYSFVAFIL